MVKEFNLSEKIEVTKDIIDRCLSEPHQVLFVSDIKEFVKREEQLLKDLRDGKISWIEFLEKRDKLLGDKLNV